MKRQFAKNLSSNWVVYATSAIISLALTPYIIAKLGKAAYGVWILVGSFSGYLGLFDFGIGYAVVRFVARYQKTGEVDKRNEIIATSFYSAAGLSLIVLAVTAFIMYNAVGFFDIPDNLVDESRLVILLIGISIAFAFPMGIFSEALAGGLWRYDLFNKVSLAVSLFQTALTIAFLEMGWGLPGLGASVLICSSAGYMWRTRMLYRLLPDLSVAWHRVKFKVLRKIGDYTTFSFILVLSGRIAFYSDSFIVGIYRGLEDVAVFGIAVKLTEYLRQLIFTLTKLFSPVAARYDPDKDKASLRVIFYKGSRLNLLFSIPLSVVLYFWGGTLIDLWIGDSFSYSKTILQVFLLGHIVSFTQSIGGEILLGVGRHKVFAILSIIAAAVNIALSVILIQKVGLVGVAWGTTIPLAVLSLGYLPYATLKMLEGKFLSYVKEALLPAIKASFLPSIIVVVSSYYIESLEQLLGVGFVTLVIYIMSGFVWGLESEEKNKIRSELSRIFK